MARQRHLREWVVKVFDLLVRPDEPPAQKAASFASGVFIGCLPLYGLHLLLSAMVARLFRLSLVRIYLGAHINNPLTAAVLLYVELGIGSLILGRPWPTQIPASLASMNMAALGMALAVGSVAVALTLAALTAVAMLRLARAWERSPDDVREVEQAARYFLESGISHWAFARGKIRHDPLYALLARSPDLAGAAAVLDLGCGTGLVLARLRERRLAAGRAAGNEHGQREQDYLGLDASPRRIAVARESLGRWGRFQVADIGKTAFPTVDTIVLADVLHYLPEVTQNAVLERAARSLRPGGTLLLREADAGGGWRFLVTRLSERLRALLRRDWRQSFCYRSRGRWMSRMAELGLDVSCQPAGRGTPFANVLITARRSKSPTG